MSYIDLHAVAYDWITLTSFEREFYKFWEKHLVETDNKPLLEKTIPRYMGQTKDLERGTGTIYAGMQNGTEHYMLHLTGPAADDHIAPAWSFVRQRIATCKRVDVQCTVPMPKEWSQFDLLKRMNDKGRITGWYESRDKGGAFQTVYIGARTSSRFTRVYIKPSGETRLLRFETEYKDNRANAMAKRLADGQESPTRYLLHELQKTIADDELSLVFEPSMAGFYPLTERLKVASSVDKTERWLTQQVYPAFVRHVNDHDASGKALAAFWAACKEAMENGS